MLDDGFEIQPCQNCGGPILRFQKKKKLEGIVKDEPVYSHEDPVCCTDWQNYLKTNPKVGNDYAQFLKSYQVNESVKGP